MLEMPLDDNRQFYINKHGDKIELVIFYYSKRIEVSAYLCKDGPPRIHFLGLGAHSSSRKKAVQQAFKNLYEQAYLNKRGIVEKSE